MGEYSSECPRGGGLQDKLFWAKFSKIRILLARSAQKIALFPCFFGQNPLKIRHFSYKWAFFLIYFNIWHLFPTIWQIFPKIIIFALQQDKIFQKPMLSKIRIFWKNIHPWGLPLVLDLAFHLVNFFGWMSQGVILSNFYFLHFFTRALLHA